MVSDFSIENGVPTQGKPRPLTAEDDPYGGKVVSIVSFPMFSFPVWNIGRLVPESETVRPWEMWLYRDFGRDPMKRVEIPDAPEQLKCLEAFAEPLREAGAMMLQNQDEIELPEWWSAAIKRFPRPDGMVGDYYGPGGVWLFALFLLGGGIETESRPRRESVGKSPIRLRIVRDVGVESAKLLRRLPSRTHLKTSQSSPVAGGPVAFDRRSMTAMGLAEKLRHLATEFRDVRQHQNWRGELTWLINRVSQLELDLESLGLMQHEKCDSPPERKGNLSFWHRGFREIFGYLHGEVSDVPESDELHRGQKYLALKPGAVAILRPGLFEPIYFAVVGADADANEIEERTEDAIDQHYFQVLGYYARACELLADWIDGKANMRSIAPAPTESPVGVGYSEAESESPSETNLQSTVLDALVRGGLAGVVQQGTRVPAIDLATAVMRDLFESDREQYGSWSAERWAKHLRVTKPTVIGRKGKPNEAWKEIMAWRESNKAERVSKETTK